MNPNAKIPRGKNIITISHQGVSLRIIAAAIEGISIMPSVHSTGFKALFTVNLDAASILLDAEFIILIIPTKVMILAQKKSSINCNFSKGSVFKSYDTSLCP